MADIIDVELNGLEYKVNIDLYDDNEYEYNDFDDSGSDICDIMPEKIEILDIYLIRKKNLYKVTNEKIWEEIEDLDLMEYYIAQI